MHDPAQRPQASINFVSPEYFRTLGIRFNRGRGFTDADRAGSMPVAVVNETFVQRYLSGVDPLNERVIIEAPAVEQLGSRIERQIVGVYADVRNGGPQNEVVPSIDLPFWQVPWPRTSVAVRTAGDSALRRAVAEAGVRQSPNWPAKRSAPPHTRR